MTAVPLPDGPPPELRYRRALRVVAALHDRAPPRRLHQHQRAAPRAIDRIVDEDRDRIAPRPARRRAITQRLEQRLLLLDNVREDVAGTFVRVAGQRQQRFDLGDLQIIDRQFLRPAFEGDAEDPPENARIITDTMGLLMEGLRLIDEAKQRPKSGRTRIISKDKTRIYRPGQDSGYHKI